MNILIIDDSDDVIFLISEFLSEDLRFSFRGASSSAEARKLIDKEYFDLIICDY